MTHSRRLCLIGFCILGLGFKDGFENSGLADFCDCRLSVIIHKSEFSAKHIFYNVCLTSLDANLLRLCGS